MFNEALIIRGLGIGGIDNPKPICRMGKNRENDEKFLKIKIKT